MQPEDEDKWLKKAQAGISSFPFLLEYGAKYHILLALTESGAIRWGYNPANSHIYSSAIRFMTGKDICDFFSLPCKTGALKDVGVSGLEALKEFYASKSWLENPAFLPSLPSYPSRNIFENKFEDYNFTTRIPLSYLRLLRMDSETLMGFVSFNDNIKNFLRWQNDWKSDINVLCDEKQRILGYDGKFAQAISAKNSVLDKPLRRYLSIDASGTTGAPLRPGKKETLLYEYPGKDTLPLEFNQAGLFSATGQGLECDTSKSEISAFVKLPVKTDFSRYDYRVELRFADVEKEPPVCILNASDLIEDVFPDAYGLLLAPLHTAESAAASDQLSYILKWGGEIISVFHEAPKAPEHGAEQGYTILKQGRSFWFYINGCFIGSHPAEDLPEKPGNDNIVFGLRPGNRVTLKSMKVTRMEISGDATVSSRKTAYFKNAPQKIYKVNSFYYPYHDSPVGLNYLRLEDLEAREKISRLLQAQKRQAAEIEKLKKGLLADRIGMDRIIGASPAIEKVKTVLKMAAPSDAAVMLTGETGTGKSLIAQVIHETSSRRQKPFVKVDCSALPESLIEAELFGFKKGAYTGAVRDTAGRFEQADGGTLFLDEIGNIPPHVQVKLLTVLQDLKVQPLGGVRPVKVDVRIITATNADLSAMVDGGHFRKDLFFRLNVIQIHLPPLREMADDIPLLSRYFLDQGFQQYPHSARSLSAGACEKLIAYGWPGNTRELYNALLKSVVLSEKEILDAQDILLPAGAGKAVPVEVAGKVPNRKKRLSLEEITREIQACKGNIRWAAHNLGLARFTLYNRLKKAGVPLDDARNPGTNL